MKRLRFLPAVLALALVPSLQAEDKEGLRVTVTKTVLDTDSERFGVRRRREVTFKQTALKVRIQNLRTTEMAESKLTYTVQLDRAGRPKRARDRTRTGSETVPALKSNVSAELIVGAVELRAANFAEKDEIDGWKLVFQLADGRTVSFQSQGFTEIP